MSQSPAPRRASPAAQPAENGHVELQQMPPGKPKLPIEEDLMQLARLGEIKAIQNLFVSKKYTPTYQDEQGITPLHVSYFDVRPFAAQRRRYRNGTDS
jgi:palmitoyltransferase ZDHHC13/17